MTIVCQSRGTYSMPWKASHFVLKVSNIDLFKSPSARCVSNKGGTCKLLTPVVIEGRQIQVAQDNNRVILQITSDLLAEEDKIWLKQVVSDLGRWEKSLSGVRPALKELGLGRQVSRSALKERNYEYETHSDSPAGPEGQRVFRVSLSVPAAQRLSAGVLESDVVAEVTNVTKWRALKRSLEALRNLFSSSEASFDKAVKPPPTSIPSVR